MKIRNRGCFTLTSLKDFYSWEMELPISEGNDHLWWTPKNMINQRLDLNEWRHRGHRASRWRDAGCTWKALFKGQLGLFHAPGLPQANAECRHQGASVASTVPVPLARTSQWSTPMSRKTKTKVKRCALEQRNDFWKKVELGCTKGKGTFATIK